jgi:crotonobetainyl-CoA:carnitine CoA-transferase CaiB-like acyl-CoA transferase
VSPVLATAEVADSALMQRATREPRAGETPLVRSPIRLPLAPLASERRDAEVLARFGFTPDEIEALVRSGALASVRD